MEVVPQVLQKRLPVEVPTLSIYIRNSQGSGLFQHRVEFIVNGEADNGSQRGGSQLFRGQLGVTSEPIMKGGNPGFEGGIGDPLLQFGYHLPYRLYQLGLNVRPYFPSTII